ncbi:putative cytochrome P450 28a5, partial [Pseudolycoriella hygida]
SSAHTLQNRIRQVLDVYSLFEKIIQNKLEKKNLSKMWMLIFQVSGVLFLLYLYMVWNFQYWKNRNVPSIKSYPIFGSFPKSFTQTLNFAYEQLAMYKEYRTKSPYVGVMSGRTPQLLLLDNTLIKDVLVKDFKNFHDNEVATFTNKESDPIFSRNPFMLNGDEWKEKRAEITPAFTSSKLKAMYPLIDDVCKKMTKFLHQQNEKELPDGFDAKELAAKYTTDVVASCIYGVESKVFSDEESIIRKMGSSIFDLKPKMLFYFILIQTFPFIQKIYQMSVVPKQVESFFINLMDDAIKLREEQKIERDDYLNYLLQLRKKKNLPNIDLVAHTITFFLDGFETSSIVIAHMFYHLAANKSVQDKLRQEINENVGKDGRIDLDVLNELEYLDQVFHETLRINPPVGMSSKVCTVATELRDYEGNILPYRTKSPYVGVMSGRTPQLLLLDNSLIKDVLVKDFKNFHDNEVSSFTNKETDPIFSRNPFMLNGDEWKEKRAEITPAFTNIKLKAMYPLIDDVCKKMTKFLHQQNEKELPDGFDAKELAAKFTTDVVASCIYGVDSKAFSDEESMIRKMGSSIFQPRLKMIIYFILIQAFPFIQKIYQMPIVSKNVESFFINLMEDAIKLREEQKIERDDYLNYLLQLKKKKNLPNIDVVAHTITFFLDGFETSSIVIAHILYHLGGNKSVQDKLRQEINENVGKDGRMDFEVLSELEYLNQVFHETLRINPPAGVSSKICTVATELRDYEGNILPVEKGMVVQIPTYCIHHDERFYPEPEKFDPDRFSAANGGLKTYRDKGVFLGFLDGPRMCLGMRFALTQSKAAVAEILRNFEVTVNTKTQEPLVLDPKAFLLLPIGGLWINLKALEYRTKSPYVGVMSGRTPQLLLLDNSLVKDVLVKDFKNFHDNEVASLLKAMYPLIDDVCKKMTKFVHRQLAAKFTTDVVASCIYGVDSKAFSDEESIIRKMGAAMFAPQPTFIIYFLLVQIFPFIQKIYRMPFVAKKVESFFEQLMEDAIKLREEQKIERDDYLNYLLQLRKKKNLPNIDVVAHTITFFLDGFETSSIVIAHILYHLGANKSVQDKLRQEINENVGKDGRIDLDVLNEMEYLDQVFHETLRINPPAGMSSKVCTVATELRDYEGNILPIEKGIVVQIPVYCIHHDERFYPEPEKFDPDRFSAANGGLKTYRDKGVFLGFLDGPRMCLGMRFALTQSKAAVAEILRNFEVTVSPKTQEPLVLDPKAFLLLPIGGLWINLKAL